MSETREQIESVADRIRDELLTTLKELDRRRHQATDIRHQVEEHVELIVLVGVGVVSLLGMGLGVAAFRRRSRRRHPLQRRAQGLLRAWEHPERLATRSDDKPMALELGRKVALAFSIAVATRLARRAAQNLVPLPPPRDANVYLS